MKNFILVFLFLLASSFSSASEVIKTCKFVVKVPGNSQVVPTVIQILKDGSKLTAKTTQIVNGQSAVLPIEDATIAEFPVRENLGPKSSQLNSAEQLIVGTAEFLASTGNEFSVGLDLKKIRAARVYQIGKFTHMGGMIIIEARDAKQNYLGAFVTGFMPFACAK